MKQYLITKDVAETLQRKIGYDLSEGTTNQVKELEREFLNEFWKYIPDEFARIALDTEELRGELRMNVLEGIPVVSLDRIYFPEADSFLEVTRSTDPITGETKITERPGADPIDQQIKGLREYGEIQLVDVGVFEGDTVKGIYDSLSKEVKIAAITVACANKSAIERLSSHPLRPLHRFELHDWIELRDFFGIDGRIVGCDNGSRTFIPYWENLEPWASIPKEYEEEVATLCKSYNQKLCSLLQYDGHDPSLIGKHIKYTAA